MKVKIVSAFEYDNCLYKTEENVKVAVARDRLRAAFKANELTPYSAGIRWGLLMEDPRKAYVILKEIFGDS